MNSSLVSDIASSVLDDFPVALIELPASVYLTSEQDFGGRAKDTVYGHDGLDNSVAINLTEHFHSVTQLGDDDLLDEDRIAVNVVRGLLEVAPKVSALFRRRSGYLAVAAPKLPKTITSGGFVRVSGVWFRWLIDYDYQIISDRLIVDTYAGFREARNV